MMKDFLAKLSAPGAEFRGAPFWAWNAKLEPEELRRQIRIMKEMGLGGFFMHSRVGLNTEYLGKDWFDCVRACIDEAEKLGMLAWLYDEDRWPSGAAGGLVTSDEKYRMRLLAHEVLDSAKDAAQDHYDALFAGELRDNRLYNVRRLKSLNDELRPNEKLLTFFEQISGISSWYNDQTYLDTMNDEAVQKFIEVTHEAYAREVGSKFGGSVPGIFTDEPNYLHVSSEFEKIVWTSSIPKRFKEAYGYDIMDHLPELFYIVDDAEFSKARLDYFNLATTLFVNAFSKQIGEWCEKNNCQMTGHVLGEDTLIGQTHMAGSPMRFYEYMQTPGIDLLTEHWNIFDTAKQCTSVAHQFDRQWRLSETYGCTGWDFPFFGHKALGDWQYALGINLRCQHLAWYSMEAEAKRDYPSSISYQSPWYKDYPVVEDYFARLGAALSVGEEVRDLLVIHPIESTWGMLAYRSLTPEMTAEENKIMVHLSNSVLRENLDFDYGDEELMSRYASVEGATLKVNKASYKAVLVPPLRTIRKSTLALLDQYRKAGGTVAYIGQVPACVDGVPSAEPAAIYKSFVQTTFDGVAKTLNPLVRRVSLTDASGREIEPLLHIYRKADKLETLFVCNTSMELAEEPMQVQMVRDRHLAYPQAQVVWQAAPGAKIFELDLSSGKIWPVDFQFKNNAYNFTTSFDALGSRLFFASAENLANAPAPRQIDTSALSSCKFSATPWQIVLNDFNVLVLDHARYAVDGGELSGNEYIIKIDDQIREKLGVRPRGGAMVQPWLSGERTADKSLELTLEYTFECGELPRETCYLGIERPDLYRISLNGREVSHDDQGYWCDRSLRKLALPADYFRSGTNTLTLTGRYHQYLPGLESLFILGSFGVNGNTLVKMPATLESGDWCTQGLQNYAGDVTYNKTFEYRKNGNPLFVEIPEWRGIAIGVRVNDSERQVIAWPPFRLDISDLVKEGTNTIAITIFGHRRNSHGPFYLNEKWPSWTGPQQFKYYDHPERQLVPCGLLQDPVLLN